jgi:uncharacterized 2Fe-2S/4Fe-4S cluster protein (DUF4445 family)
MSHQVRVTFEPQGRAVHVLAGTTVVEAATLAGLALDIPCGGAGICGKCRVQITSGAPKAGPGDKKFFSEAEIAAGWRLGCQTALDQDAVVSVPQSSMFSIQAQILAEAHKNSGQVLPAVRKVYVELPPPSLEDDHADLRRLEQVIGKVKIDLPMLRKAPGVFRQSSFKVTAVLTDHHLIGIEPGDTSSHCYGAAFDIGTTTLVGSLLDLQTGGELALVSGLNPQVRFGDDVLSRIQHACGGGDKLNELRDVIITALNEMIARLCAEARVDATHIYEATLAGNTTMEHLLAGVDVAQLGQVPFAPCWARGLMVGAEELGLKIAPNGAAYLFPIIGGFVGGDTSAGILATRIGKMAGPILMVDIGTNGEIVLSHEGRTWAASTAAGPAFEGARISCGMRATNGAIEKVVINEEIETGVIGGCQATGLCGSGLIDLVAELLRLGVITPEGRLLPADELPSSLSENLKRRVKLDSTGQVKFIVCGGDSSDAPEVSLGYRDVRELQLACAAIRAGIRILLKQAGLEATDLRRVLVAGGFGSYIRRDNARRIGLLPVEVSPSKIGYVGNASLQGARCALVSTEARKELEEAAAQVVHVELSCNMDFQAEFAEAMIFPEPGV